ncbi:hypothetical protein SY89_02526 [Halolamina pelagica]|uniref:Uncharacterized protein n=1 Tax=Halolamina pelagica TaxID=699431 RepID=A0A0P7GR82_9EURY|nr:hypothetical protein SY89_02526 [Halolamina pelagica]
MEHGNPLLGGVALACSSIVVALLSWLGVVPFALLSGYQLAGVVTLSFSLLAVGFYLNYHPTRMNRLAKRHDTDYGCDDD